MRQQADLFGRFGRSKGGVFMLAKILCFIGGAAFGVAAMCVFITAGNDDERLGIK